jgi:hypothetical protein
MAQSPFFSASCLASNGTRNHGTVPVNQNLIQVDGFLSPCRAGCCGRTPERAELPAAAARSDHPIVENSQRWSREAIAIVSASRATRSPVFAPVRVVRRCCKGEPITMKSAFSFFPAWPLAPDAIFWAGLALLAAGLCGELCYRAWRLPRISGYAVIGLIAGAAGSGVIDSDSASAARPLLDVALGLLLFELGSRLDLRWIRRNPWLILSSVAEATLTFALVLPVLLFLNVPLMVATVLAAIAMATSPAMVIQLKTELRAEGQVTQRLLTLTALNSMYAVVIEKLVSSWLH